MKTWRLARTVFLPAELTISAHPTTVTLFRSPSGLLLPCEGPNYRRHTRQFTCQPQTSNPLFRGSCYDFKPQHLGTKPIFPCGLLNRNTRKRKGTMIGCWYSPMSDPNIASTSLARWLLTPLTWATAGPSAPINTFASRLWVVVVHDAASPPHSRLRGRDAIVTEMAEDGDRHWGLTASRWQ